MRRWRDQVVELLSARAADLRLIVEAGLERPEAPPRNCRGRAGKVRQGSPAMVGLPNPGIWVVSGWRVGGCRRHRAEVYCRARAWTPAYGSAPEKLSLVLQTTDAGTE